MSKADHLEGLDHVRIRLLLNYMVDLNAARVAEEMRLAPDVCQAMLEEPAVQAAFVALETQRARRLLLDGDVIVNALWETANEARANKQFSAAKDALKLLGEHFGLFKQLTASARVSDTRPEAKPAIVQNAVVVQFGRNPSDPLPEAILHENNGVLERPKELDGQAAALPRRTHETGRVQRLRKEQERVKALRSEG